jgi:hypothetical protein
MKIPWWITRWLNSRKPARAFVPGMTLQPGESFYIDTMLELELPPEVHEAVLAAQARGEPVGMCSPKPPRETSPGHYVKEVELMIAGRVVAMLHVEYTA